MSVRERLKNAHNSLLRALKGRNGQKCGQKKRHSEECPAKSRFGRGEKQRGDSCGTVPECGSLHRKPRSSAHRKRELDSETKKECPWALLNMNYKGAHININHHIGILMDDRAQILKGQDLI